MTNNNNFNPTDFRKALGTFTTGVTIVTTVGLQGEDIGLTANSFNSVSLDPPMVLWSLAKSALSLEAFKAAKHFSVHILSEGQTELSGRFARRGEDKFAGLDIERGLGSVPLLNDCAARFVCESEYQYEGGDHIIFVGRVVDFKQSEAQPLVFHSGEYGLLVKSGKGPDNDPEGDYLGDLMRRAYRILYTPMELELKRRSISIPQYFFLSRSAQLDHPSIQELNTLLAGGREPSDPEIKDLEQPRLIEIDGDVIHLTPTGITTNLELASLLKSTETDAEAGLDYNLRQSLKIALKQLISISEPA
jgi:3-hydroxy-9,10-secoandrosta-1,3,5(10)-triene-9,17-dione monooxygenase reductase component